MKSLLLALGNDLLGDDGVGLAAARELKKELLKDIDVIETSESGLVLMELMAGYDHVLLLDAILTGSHCPGTILEFKPEDFQRTVAPSPHYAGLPEVLELAAQLQIPFPKDIQILAIEVENPFEFKLNMSSFVMDSFPDFINKARSILQGFNC